MILFVVIFCLVGFTRCDILNPDEDNQGELTTWQSK